LQHKHSRDILGVHANIITAVIHLEYFLVPIVVKTVLQKEQEFEGAALIVKPYEESIKKDNQDYEV